MTDSNLLLSRIRSRAASQGLRVKLRDAGGMFNTLATMFKPEEEDDTQDDTLLQLALDEEVDDEEDSQE